MKYEHVTLVDSVPAAALGGGASRCSRCDTATSARSCPLARLCRLRSHGLVHRAPTACMSTPTTAVNWLTIGDLNVDFGLKLDALSMMMMLIVTGVGGAIHIYSYGYMHDDRGMARFFACLSLFTFSMLGIVLANNFMRCSSSGNWSACPATCSSVSGLKSPARRRGEKGLHHQPLRRLRLPAGHFDGVGIARLVEFRQRCKRARCQSRGARRHAPPWPAC